MSGDPYKYFRVEARELLQQLEQGALDLEKSAPSGDAIARLLRVAHTLKGAARVVKQPGIAEHAHELEDLFAAARDSSGAEPRRQIDRMLWLLDAISRQLGALGSDRPSGAESAPVSPPPEPVHGFHPEAADMDALVEGIAEARVHLSALRPRLDQTDRIGHLIELTERQLGALRTRGAAAHGAGSPLEKTRSLVEELRTRFAALERAIVSEVDHIERELRHVSEAASRLRLVPASAMFQFLERTARDAALAVGKQVTFAGRGGEVRLESGVLHVVQRALLQVVRNAVAHGIEPTAHERVAAGKTSEGHVTLVVSRRGASVSFVVADDGRGIDFDSIRRTLQQRGQSVSEHQTLDREALLGLLLKGGISTSRTVTDVAGRGIGLDVVREAAERLGGEVTMHSDTGRGTSVEVMVPSSVVSFPALLVDAGGVSAAVPMEAIRRTIRLTPEHIVDTARGETMVHDGAPVPLVALHRLVVPGAPRARAGRGSIALVVETAAGTGAFAVDRVLGRATVVMHPLPDLAPAAAVVAGASLETGGEPRLVLDPVQLVMEAQRIGGFEPDDAPPSQASILVVDDSLTTRMLEQSILESAGYDVGLASSGEEGLQKARAGDYALYLVDVEMPGIDGFTFIEQIRSEPKLRDVPAILVTSRASAEDRQRGRDVGAQDYIIKSDFDQGVLLARIRTLVQ